MEDDDGDVVHLAHQSGHVRFERLRRHVARAFDVSADVVVVAHVYDCDFLLLLFLWWWC